MKYYIEVPDEECPLKSDLEVRDNMDNLLFFRPVEIRNVDELTEEEIAAIYVRFICRTDTETQRECIKGISDLLDELRMKPRETKKEKWIREYMERRGLVPETAKCNVEEIWDAAIASVKGKGE